MRHIDLYPSFNQQRREIVPFCSRVVKRHSTCISLSCFEICSCVPEQPETYLSVSTGRIAKAQSVKRRQAAVRARVHRHAFREQPTKSTKVADLCSSVDHMHLRGLTRSARYKAEMTQPLSRAQKQAALQPGSAAALRECADSI